LTFEAKKPDEIRAAGMELCLCTSRPFFWILDGQWPETAFIHRRTLSKKNGEMSRTENGRKEYYMKRVLMTGFLVACTMFVLTTSASALPTMVYSTGFDSGADAAWSNAHLASTSALGQYLGNYSRSNGATLTLSGLPAHSLLALQFDLYLFSTWDGNDTHYGPDFFSLSGDATGSWTFTNHQSEGQSYPGSPDQTYGSPGMHQTHVYRGLDPTGTGDEFLVSHTNGSFSVTFGGPTTQTDEWWGIDNVKVFVNELSEASDTGCAHPSPTPEPATMLLLGSGLAGFVGFRKRIKR
jgi:hypothetical protein